MLPRIKYKNLITLAIALLAAVLVLGGCGSFAPKQELAEEIQDKVVSNLDVKMKEFLSQDWNSRPDRFYYSRLTDDEKKAYLRIESACEDLGMGVIDFDMNSISEDGFLNALSAVWGDNPELFWVIKTGTYLEDPDAADGEKMINGFQLDKSPYAMMDIEQLEPIVDAIIAGIPEGATDYDKVKYFFDWIVDNTDYVEGSKDQDFRSVFLENQSRCAGYSDAFQYLCQKVGIPCASVTGWTHNEEIDENYHEWNIIQLDGEIYWVDVTSGDSLGDQGDWPTNYNYLCMTDEDVYDVYIIDKHYGSVAPKEFDYPVSLDDSLDYYKNNGEYFEEYTYGELAEYIREKLIEGQTEKIELKFKNKDDYEDALYQIMEAQELFDVVFEVFPYGTEAYIDSIQDEPFNYVCLTVNVY